MSKYEPITNIHPQNNVLRDDIVKQEYNRDELLSDAIVRWIYSSSTINR